MSDTDRLIKVFSTTVGRELSREELTGGNLISSLGLNSIDALQLLIQVETEFGFNIEDEELSIDLVDSLERLETFVASKQPARTA
ncbi:MULTISPECIES: acyl carrier protein [Pseudomonas]|uniref:Phosphopantetheine-containing protein n=1 Tax=Pseudomonas asplenii TaxID=53407 RepID=A0A0M9GJ25_9PSED|nr:MULTISPECIES: acyl carrier protein [Pseudomonas]KPA92135.1 phosphopantetheine-containing protein [Pseudomonas fuscovaginae]KPA97985.1 phosphopantetheine-containing protein [Pseudomonas fuscovaginae]MBG6886139.1 acyl carrier protein [Pseudomonas aeruginosa]MCY0315503.1 acyl carrier protein [Pseudomonas aeruginosa]MCY0517476.1 acyl carrier protein [Pseudomonas aeruginosa]